MRTKTILALLTAILPCIFPVTGSAAEPEVRVLDSIKNQYGPVRFDHKKHTALADSCATCHHEHNAARGFPCKQCHALTQDTFRDSVAHGFMPCANCHGAPDPENPGLPGLKTAYHVQCFACHKGMGDIGNGPQGCTQVCHEKRADATGKR